MRRDVRAALAAGLLGAAAILAGGPADARDRDRNRIGRDENPDGYGFYTPLAKQRGAYRYDPRSWYYRQPGYYPNYASNYWVPRSEMRYRYRYTYYGPKYRYYPAWGYPLWDRADGCCDRGRW